MVEYNIVEVVSFNSSPGLKSGAFLKPEVCNNIEFEIKNFWSIQILKTGDLLKVKICNKINWQ